MRELIKRLERLECSRLRQPPRIVRRIIGAENGAEKPWNPSWARPRNGGEEITREATETVAGFEARAAETFPANYVIG